MASASVITFEGTLELLHAVNFASYSPFISADLICLSIITLHTDKLYIFFFSGT